MLNYQIINLHRWKAKGKRSGGSTGNQPPYLNSRRKERLELMFWRETYGKVQLRRPRPEQSCRIKKRKVLSKYSIACNSAVFRTSVKFYDPFTRLTKFITSLHNQI